MPDVHRSATKAAGRTVYEARSQSGAGWRGALVLDDGVMWLVFADRHDRFHASAADYIKKGTWRPGSLDVELAAQDAEYVRLRRWRVDTLAVVLSALGESAANSRPVEEKIADPFGGNSCNLRIEIDHDIPALSASLAHTTAGLLLVSLLIRGASRRLVEEIISVMAIIRDGEQDQAFLPGGDLQLLYTMTHARLAQLTADVATSASAALQPTRVPNSTALHYVSRPTLAEALVNGTALLTLCGEWFVPRHDDSALLPICAVCEQRQPHAQAVLDALRCQR